MKILVIGGNSFFGKKLVDRALAANHEVTVFNRGNKKVEYRGTVRSVVGNRNDRVALYGVANLEEWDVVFDQACYEAVQARVSADVFKARTKQYIFTSSQAVYPKSAENLREHDFIPSSHAFETDAICSKNYGEAKRQCEAIFTRAMPDSLTCVRFPIVLGLTDPLERLAPHIRAVLSGNPVSYPNLESKISFVSDDLAAAALLHLATKKVFGCINVSSSDALTIAEFDNLIHERVGPIRRGSSGPRLVSSPLKWASTYTMNVERLVASGLEPPAMSEWLPTLIDQTARIERDRLAQQDELDRIFQRYQPSVLTARVSASRDKPFRVIQFDNFFAPEFYQELVKSYRERLTHGLNVNRMNAPAGSFSRSEAVVKDGATEQRYGAFVSRILERDQSPFGIFYSKMFFDRMQALFDVRFSPHMMGSIHHHEVGSPTGWIHNDYHFCNFPWAPTADGLNPWAPGAHYQSGYDGRPHIHNCPRSVALIYYFANEPWAEGDGGETCFFDSRDWSNMSLKVPPINNTAVAFEVTPKSFHTFISNRQSTRTSVAFWFHSDKHVALSRFGLLPDVNSI